ncbi:Zinc finger, C3HC4 type (RING finger) [Musa troglodytarum]|uniref:RING-type E3 ubiquitin transferase n=1 Tax=Musa troglodytarum TaxID=320322 RepID=A0A9E7GP27_9LILI|nr:Zinc finger, C3HC4 type (RING finger) [Musa troglodytarum]
MSNNGSASAADQTDCCSSGTTLGLIDVFLFLIVVYVVIHYTRYLELEANGRWHDRQKPGLYPSAIAALPSFAYQRGADGRSSSEECCVCVSVVEEGEVVRVLPSCDHRFHAACVDLWLQGHPTCPLCRADAAPGRAVEGVKVTGARPSPAPPAELHTVVSVMDVGESSASQPMR